MNIGRILPTEAAAILNVSPQFVRVAMQQGKLPIGTAVQMSSIWTYHISEKLLADYSGKNIEKEIERIRGGVENDEKGCMSSHVGAYRTGVLIMGKSTSRGGFSETKRTANMFSRWIFDTFSRVLTMMS